VVLARKSVVKVEHLAESVRSPVVSLETDVDAGIRRLVDRMISEAPHGDMFRQIESRWEKVLLRRILDLTGGNQLKASELLGITRTTVKRKMDLHGL